MKFCESIGVSIFFNTFNCRINVIHKSMQIVTRISIDYPTNDIRVIIKFEFNPRYFKIISKFGLF